MYKGVEGEYEGRHEETGPTQITTAGKPPPQAGDLLLMYYDHMPTRPTSESDPFQPVGKILDQDGKDVSARDRSDDGTIIIRRNREVGHNYFFGSLPQLPWHKITCPQCNGRRTVPIPGDLGYYRYCELCEGQGEVKSFVGRKYVKRLIEYQGEHIWRVAHPDPIEIETLDGFEPIDFKSASQIQATWFPLCLKMECVISPTRGHLSDEPIPVDFEIKTDL